jgi:hypothetical protein
MATGMGLMVVGETSWPDGETIVEAAFADLTPAADGSAVVEMRAC